LADYLLNENHPKGKSKAKWLPNRGFDQEKLKISLEIHGQNGMVVKKETGPFGTFEIRLDQLNALWK